MFHDLFQGKLFDLAFKGVFLGVLKGDIGQLYLFFAVGDTGDGLELRLLSNSHGHAVNHLIAVGLFTKPAVLRRGGKLRAFNMVRIDTGSD